MLCCICVVLIGLFCLLLIVVCLMLVFVCLVFSWGCIEYYLCVEFSCCGLWCGFMNIYCWFG